MLTHSRHMSSIHLKTTHSVAAIRSSTQKLRTTAPSVAAAVSTPLSPRMQNILYEIGYGLQVGTSWQLDLTQPKPAMSGGSTEPKMTKYDATRRHLLKTFISVRVTSCQIVLWYGYGFWVPNQHVIICFANPRWPSDSPWKLSFRIYII